LIYAHIINVTLKIFPLAKDANGYVVIEAAWDRLLAKPALPTDDFDELFFPSDQAAEPFGQNGRRCRIKASVTESGQAKWEPHPPCGQELESVDSYRRHVINQHLACPRYASSAKQGDWICEPLYFTGVHMLIIHTVKRRLDVVRSNTY
jgi:hypothetical protein